MLRALLPKFAPIIESLSPLCTLVQSRSFAYVVDVTNGNVDAAMRRLQQKCKREGLYDELKKREFYLRPSARRHDYERKKYNRKMGEVIQERLKWVLKKRRVKL